IGLPTSRASRRASGSVRSTTSVRNRPTISRRRASGIAAQPGWAARARRTVAATSARSALSTSATTSSEAGSITRTRDGSLSRDARSLLFELVLFLLEVVDLLVDLAGLLLVLFLVLRVHLQAGVDLLERRIDVLDGFGAVAVEVTLRR